jgi:hypothetical protein
MTGDREMRTTRGLNDSQLTLAGDAGDDPAQGDRTMKVADGDDGCGVESKDAGRTISQHNKN